MLTPLDIEKREFKKRLFGGYGAGEVDEFLDRVLHDYETLYKENIELKDKVSMMSESIQHYKLIEDTLQNTLVVAQSTSEDIKRNAYEKADNILKDAEVKAQSLINQASQEVFKINMQYQDLRGKLETYRVRMEALLAAQLEILRKEYGEQDGDAGNSKGQAGA